MAGPNDGFARGKGEGEGKGRDKDEMTTTGSCDALAGRVEMEDRNE